MHRLYQHPVTAICGQNIFMDSNDSRKKQQQSIVPCVGDLCFFEAEILFSNII